MPLSKSHDMSLKRIKEEIDLSGWGGTTGPEIEEASEFGIPVLAEIDAKIDPPGSSYRDIFLDIENINFENNILDKANAKSIEPSVPEESSKEMLKLVPKQVLSRKASELAKLTTSSPEVLKKKGSEVDSQELPKPVDIIKTENKQPSPVLVRSKSPTIVKKKSPSRKERESENRGKSTNKNSEKETKDKKEYQSRSSKRSPTSSWDSKEIPAKSESSSRTVSRSKSRSRSRSPRRRDDRAKSAHSKRDKRSPVKQTSYRGNVPHHFNYLIRL